MKQEYYIVEVNEELKWVCIKVEGLEFATLVEVDVDNQIIANQRWTEINVDYEEWGNYLHSDLSIDKTKKEQE